VFQRQPGQIVLDTLSQKILHKNRAGGVAQSENSEFKTQYCKKKKKNLRNFLVVICSNIAVLHFLSSFSEIAEYIYMQLNVLNIWMLFHWSLRLPYNFLIFFPFP
jgi:hypothetical protein